MKILTIIIALVIAVALGLAIDHDPGKVTIKYSSFLVEKPLWEALAAIIISGFVLLIIYKFTAFILNIKPLIDRYRKERIAKKNAASIELLCYAFVNKHDHRAILPYLPQLKQLGLIDAKLQREYEIKLAISVLTMLKSSGNLKQVYKYWSSLNKTLRQEAILLKEYVALLCYYQDYTNAEATVRHILNHAWQDDIVILYGNIITNNLPKQIKIAEGWLKEHGDSAELLFTLGKLCIAYKMWGKARGYLEASIRLKQNMQALFALGGLLEKLGESEHAMLCYQRGISLEQTTGNSELVSIGWNNS